MPEDKLVLFTDDQLNRAEFGRYESGSVVRYDEQFDKYSPGKHIDFNENAFKAHQQPWYDQLGNAAMQGVAGEIVGGTIENIGYLGEVLNIGKISDGQQKEWGNALSELGKRIKEGTQEAFPIYQKAPGEFNPSDSGWWFGHFPSTLSTLSLAIPGGAIVKGMGAVGRGLKITQSLVGAAKKAGMAPQYIKALGDGLEGIALATISRHGESMMEGAGTFDEVFNERLKQINKKTGALYTEDEARQAAAEAAAFVYNKNWYMLLQDIPQYMFLLRGMRGVRAKAAQAAKTKSLGSKVMAHSLDMASEGLEEAYQYGVGKEAKYFSDLEAGLIDESSFTDRLREYSKDGEMWSSAFWGAMGAGVMQSSRYAIGAMDNAFRNKNADEAAQQGMFRAAINLGLKASVNQFVKSSIEREDFGSVMSEIDILLNTSKEELEAQGYSKELLETVKPIMNILKDNYENNLFGKYSKEITGKILTAQAEAFIDKNHLDHVINKGISDNLKQHDASLAGLSTIGRSIFDLQIQTEALKKAIKAEKKSTKPSQENIDFLTTELQAKESKLAQLKREERAKEVKSKDDKILKSVPTAQLVGLHLDKYLTELSILDNEKEIKNLIDNNKEVQDTIDKNKTTATNQKIDVLKKRLREAKTPEEKSVIFREAEDAGVLPAIEQYHTELINSEGVTNPWNVADDSSLEESTIKATPLSKEELENQISTEEALKQQKRNEEFAGKIKTRYNSPNGEELFKKELEEINKHLESKGLQRIDPNTSVDDFIKFLLESPEHKKEVITAYRKMLDKVNENTTLNTGTPEEFELTEDNPGDLDNPEDYTEWIEREPTDSFHTRAWRFNFIKKFIGKVYRWIPQYINKSLQENPLGNIGNLAWDKIDNPKYLKPGTKLEYVVDLNYKEGGYTTDVNSPDFNIDSFQVVLVSREEEGGEYNASLLPTYRADSDNSNSLKSLREAIVQKLRDGTAEIKDGKLYTGITTKVTAKHAGRIWLTPTFNFPHQVLGEKQKFVLGVAVRNNDGTIGIRVPNNNDARYNKVFTTATPGKAYLLVEAANGEIIPVRLFTQKIGYLPEATKREFYNRIFGLLSALNKDSTSDELESVRAELKKLVHVSFYFDKNTGKFITIEGKKHTTRDNTKFEDIVDWLDDKIVQIDVNSINTGKYNKTISEQGRLLTRLNVEQFTHSSRVDVTPYSEAQPKSEATTKTLEKKKAEIEVPKLSTVKINLSTLSIEELKNVAKQLRQKAVNAREAEKKGKTVLGGSAFIENDYQAIKKYIAELAALEKGTVPKAELAPGIPMPTDETEFSIGEEDLKGAEDLSDVFGVTAKDIAEAQKETNTPIDNLDINEPTETEKKVNKGKAKRGRKGSSGLNNTDEEGKLRVANKESRVWDKEAELSYLKKVLGENFPVSILDDLIEIHKKGGITAWGIYKNAAVYLANSAGKGTGYHEAFHAIFDLALTDKQRQELLMKAQAESGLQTDEELEEYLADKFMEYVMEREAGIKPTITGKIASFFKRLYYTIKDFIFNDTISIEGVFNRIDIGYYKNKVMSERTSKFADKIRFRIPGMSPLEQSKAIKLLNIEFFKVLDYLRTTTTGYKDLTDIEIINKYGGAGEIYKEAIINLLVDRDEIIAKKYGEESELYKRYDKLIGHAAEFNDDGDISKLNNLVKIASFFLSDYGISLRWTNKPSETTDETGNILNTDVIEDETELEGWQSNTATKNGKDTASYRIKRELKTLKKLDNNGKAVSDGYYAVPDLVDFDTLWNKLEEKLSNLFSWEKMKSELETLIQEYDYSLKPFLDKLENNDQLRAEFVTTMNKAHKQYIFVKQQDDGTFRVFNSNRMQLSDVIINQWIAFGTRPGKDNFINEDGSINTAKAVTALNDYLEKVNVLKAKNTPITVEDLKTIEPVLRKIGVDITAAELHKTAHVKSGAIGEKQNLLKILIGPGSIEGILRTFADGHNPYDTTVIETEGKKVERTSRDIFAKLAKLVSPAREQMYQLSFVNIANDNVYAIQVPSYLWGTLAAIKEDYEDFKEFHATDEFIKTLPLFEELSHIETRDNFTITNFDGLKNKGEEEGSDYMSLSPKDLELAAIQIFLNNTRSTLNTTKGYGYYRISVQSDSTNMIAVKYKRFEIDGVIEQIYEIAKGEYIRIQKSRKNLEDLDVKNYNKNAAKFVNLPFLEGKNLDIINQEDLVKEEISKYLEQEYLKYLDYLKENEILDLEKDVKGKYKINALNVLNPEALVKNFFYNNYVAHKQFSILFDGDKAFYNKIGDLQKRAKQSTSTKDIGDLYAKYVDEQGKTHTVRPNYRVAVLQDNEVVSPRIQQIKEATDKLVEKGTWTKLKQLQVLAKYGYRYNELGVADDIFESNGKRFIKFENHEIEINLVNETDAQTYITLERFREIKIARGLWNHRYQKAFDNAKQGKATAEDLFLFSPLKPFYFSKHKINGNIVPIQDKNSEFVLLPQVAKKSPKLSKLLDAMYANEIDSVLFNSAVKVGLHGVNTFENLTGANPVIQERNQKDYGIQQEVPTKHVDANIIFGTQIRKQILSNLNLNAEYIVAGKPVTGQELFNMYQELISNDITERFEEIKSEVNSLDSVHNLLFREILDRGLNEDAVESIKIVDRGNGKEFNLPLWFPTISSRSQALLLSSFKNTVVKHKVPGAGLVQVSGFGFSDKLNLKINTTTGALEYMEVMLPWWSKQYFPKDENGEVDMSKIPNELKDILGYRIPTEGKYSMVPMRVKGFLPQESGSSIILPTEITAITGSDFDVDKMYLLLPEMDVISEEIAGGEEMYQNYISTLQWSPKAERDIVRKDIEDFDDKRARIEFANKKGFVWNEKAKVFKTKTTIQKSTDSSHNKKLDIMLSILKSPEHFDEIIEPGGFDNYKDIADKIQKKENVLNKAELDMALSHNWAEVFENNKAGVALKGIFANHAASHAVAQYYTMALNTEVTFNGSIYSNLSDNANKSISRNLSSLLAAAVDNAKEPILNFLNVNILTADTFALLLRVGVSDETASYFMAQPVLKDLVRYATNKGISLDKAFTPFLKEFKEKIKTSYDTDISGRYNLTDAELTKYISQGKQKDRYASKSFVEGQLKVLNSFAIYHATAKELGTLIRLTAPDKIKGPGSMFADYTRAIRDVKALLPDGNGNTRRMLMYINGYEDFVKGTFFPMMKEFYDKGIEGTHSELEKYFPTLSAGNKTVNAILNRLEDILDDRTLSSNEVNYIVQHFLTYIASGYGFLRMSPRRIMVDLMGDRAVNGITSKTSFINNFITLLEKHPELRKNNALIKRLNIIKNTKRTPYDIIEFNNVGSMTEVTKQEVSYAWEELFNDPELSPYAKGLFAYTFYKSGFAFNSSTFTHLTPIEWLANFKDKNEELSFVDFMKNEVNSTYNAQFDELINDFLEQFFRNNINKKAFIVHMNYDGKDVYDISKDPNQSTVRVDVNNAKSLKFFKSTLKGYVPKPYMGKIVTTSNFEKQYFMYKFVGWENHGDTKLAVYQRVPMKGHPGVYLSYTRNTAGTQAIAAEDVPMATPGDTVIPSTPTAHVPYNPANDVVSKQSVTPRQGIAELFEQNPELAQSVYEVLGFKKEQDYSNKIIINKLTELLEEADKLLQEVSKNKKVIDPLVSMTSDRNLYSDYIYIKKESEKLFPNNEKQKVIIHYIDEISKKGESLNNLDIFNSNNEFNIDEELENLTESQNRVLKSREDVINLISSFKQPQITPQQKQQAQQLYSQYLDTIFPDSKVKDIVYHGTNRIFDKFLAPNRRFSDWSTELRKMVSEDSKGAIYFTNRLDLAQNSGKNIKASRVVNSLLNIKNPKETTTQVGIDDSIPKLKKEGFDSYLFTNNKANYIVQAVFEPEQIHILGGKNDIENFAKFLKNSELGNVKDMKNYMNSKSVDYIMNKLIQSGKIEKRC